MIIPRYTCRDIEGANFPFKIDSVAQYSQPSNTNIIVLLRVTFQNSSPVMNMKDIATTIPLSFLRSITSISHETTFSGSVKEISCSVFESTNLDGVPAVQLKIEKLKLESKFMVKLVVTVCIFNGSFNNFRGKWIKS